MVDVHGIDLSKSAEVNKFTHDVLAKYKSVDVLVNNAGMGTSSGSGPIDGESESLGQYHNCCASYARPSTYRPSLVLLCFVFKLYMPCLATTV